MSRIVLVSTTLVMALAVAGCETLTPVLPDSRTVETTGSISRPQSEEPILVYRPEIGLVRGTRPVLAGLGVPLQPEPGHNRALAACREAVQAEAGKLGAREVEAVSAGPERHNNRGQFVGPVRIRITYERLVGYEVREATVRCVVDQTGKLVGTV